MTELTKQNEKRKWLYSAIYPVLFVSLLWIIQIIQSVSGADWAQWGLYPRTVHGLIGIITEPLLHAGFAHLFSNTIPLLVLGTSLFYFYGKLGFKVFFWIYLITGLWVWVGAREAYHIGASGIVYGLVCFLFFSGLFRRNTRLLALSLFVVFIYGSLVWGVFPIVRTISWESHLLGSFAGIITAIYFRKEGPGKDKYQWDEEDEENDEVDTLDIDFEYIEEPESPKAPPINYIFVPGKKKGKDQ